MILFGNHQTEPDPQAIILMLEKVYPNWPADDLRGGASRDVRSAGGPFQHGNQPALRLLQKACRNRPCDKGRENAAQPAHDEKNAAAAHEGGKCIYIAPSGGRDRLNVHGRLAVAPFDPQSIEMSWLIGKKAEKKTHFFPLSLSTYNLLPPPSNVQQQLGEPRHAHCTPLHLAFGPEIEMADFPGAKLEERNEQKKKRAEYIWSLVAKNYDKFPDQ